jgi:hypothetical protein
MAQGDYHYPSTFGLGRGSDTSLSSYMQGAYPDNGCWGIRYLPEQQHQNTTSNFWKNSFGTAGFMSLAQSTTDTTPIFPDQTDIPAKHIPATAASTSPSTPPPPTKRGRGRPRKNNRAPRPEKKAKTSLPSSSTSQASSQELPTDNSRPEDNDDEPSFNLSLPEDASETRLPGAKLDRRRERNREAAQKCRTRKQHSTQKLVADVAAAEAINESLRQESKGLREETLLLKSMVLQHGECDCAYIQAYIKNAASRLALEDGGCLATLARSPGSRTTHEHQKQQQAAAFAARTRSF